ncbi:hypothetical protein VPH35_130594 [Triticum aestivum]|uniref:F-box protein At5g03100 n=1 Tax=Triticum aestivum TaxID=4565 RepID=UPI001D002564|nr:F-box protein At5g03100-like [Triticum aestivum]XP_044432727.1 F-box protein At5g03100-like [Triticum aestivum]
MSAPASIPCGSKSVRGNDNGVDRLSSLSDDLLHHVMSFLPTPEVVRTSLLSPRWRNLWSSVPFIHINNKDFVVKNDVGIACFDNHKLENFVDHLLLLRDGTVSLDEVRVVITTRSSKKSSVWIRHAIKHKVRLLHISGFHHHLILDSTAMFPSLYLKRIRLWYVRLNDWFNKPLNYDWPVLEHLELECCILDTRRISSSSLKVLHIIDCIIGNDLLIGARKLTHLSVIDPECRRGAIVTWDLSSLVSASLSLGSEFHYDDNTEVDHHLLDGLSHATTLELHAPLPELTFERGLQACPMFSNLTSLVLGDWCMAADFYPLFRIVHRSPMLKELTVKLKMEHCETRKEVESASLPSRRAPAIRGYPRIERIKICCSKDDPRIGTLVQALLPIFIPDGKISIEGY